ncbi:LytR cell envelope-related transcriptional attenuator [Amycolatopsis xylanica]|uniref:LytR cell envelope-related transcriptional attenuator n=1 Tax=Amycolatopsis xylanica TaxID=589385 RepID=A0A1H2YQE4_9PSEU|nr:LytR C-terminal domain-containing protein [Amycolatopsis xylanica]SDX06749.1 LytR cell envelope-related transcriptional attenuator [Amycolatopsis xylanica]
MSVFSGLSRPLKAAGLALIGLAVIAGVIGGVTALTGGESNDTAQPSQSSNPPPPASSSPAPSSSAPASSAPPSSSASPSPSTSPSAPASTAPGGVQPTPGGQPGGPQQVAKWVTVRVYNNSTIHGLAARAAEDFKASGWNVAEVSNYSSGIIPATTAYYRPGTDEEQAAKALAAEFGMRAEARFEGIQQSSPGVIVIVTNNYQTAKGK